LIMVQAIYQGVASRRLLLRSGAAASAESFFRLDFALSLPSTSESQGSGPPKPQSASESQPSPASSRGSASSNDRSAMKGPKSDLDEDGEDDRVRVPPSARASSAGEGRSERASMGLMAVLCPPTQVEPSLTSRSWGSEGDPTVSVKEPASSRGRPPPLPLSCATAGHPLSRSVRICCLSNSYSRTDKRPRSSSPTVRSSFTSGSSVSLAALFSWAALRRGRPPFEATVLGRPTINVPARSSWHTGFPLADEPPRCIRLGNTREAFPFCSPSSFPRHTISLPPAFASA